MLLLNQSKKNESRHIEKVEKSDDIKVINLKITISKEHFDKYEKKNQQIGVFWKKFRYCETEYC